MKFIHVFLLVLTVFTWGFIHSLTASFQFKAFIRRIFGIKSDRYYRLAFNAISVVTFVAVLVVAALIPDTTIYVVPFPWVALLIIVEILAVAALIIAFLQTDPLDFIGIRQATGTKKQHSHLLKDGLYQYVRHPFYTAGIIIIWALPLMTARLFVLDLALTTYVIVGAYFEERKMRQKFGHQFVEYAAITPMFVPFIKQTKRRTSPADKFGKV